MTDKTNAELVAEARRLIECLEAYPQPENVADTQLALAGIVPQLTDALERVERGRADVERANVELEDKITEIELGNHGVVGALRSRIAALESERDLLKAVVEIIKERLEETGYPPEDFREDVRVDIAAVEAAKKEPSQ